MSASRRAPPAEPTSAELRKRLVRYGITLETGVATGKVLLSAAETSGRCPTYKALPAILIRYWDPRTGQPMTFDSGDAQFERVRYLYDGPGAKGFDGKTTDPPRYGQPPDSGVCAYFPHRIPKIDWPALRADRSAPLILTEGEFKADKACQEGFPTIALGGVSNFGSAWRGVEILPELAWIDWTGRVLFVAFDSDLRDNPDVAAALRRIVDILRPLGAEVYVVQLPSIGGDKTGLDDFLIARGAPALRRLLDATRTNGGGWRQLFYPNATGGALANLANVMIGLRLAPQLRNCLRFDEMARGPMVANLPGSASNAPRPLADADVSSIQEWLQRNRLSSVGAEAVRAGIDLRSRERSFHPIRDYLNALKWDCVKRVGKWLTRYLGVTHEPYTEAVGKMFLISMIARVMQPGCKVDYMLTLQGGQGPGKSTICRVLAGDEWFGDSPPKLSGNNLVRASVYLRGKWIIEYSELSAMKNSEVEDIKAFISRQHEKYVPPYGHAEVDEPRQCVFVGTTNAAVYLKDHTGNRRDWGVVIGAVDVPSLRADRDQLFAEAMDLYRNGEPWWPDRDFEVAHIVPQQEARYETDDWAAEIVEFMRINESVKAWSELGCEAAPVTNSVLYAYLGVDKKDFDARKQVRLGIVMEKLGWVRHRSAGIRRWIPGDAAIKAAGHDAPPPPQKRKRKNY